MTQGIGLVRVTLEYSSPNVHGPDGKDRAGHIWGELVPYGLYDLAYNDCKQCPWRGGANENTVFTVSHPVKIEGQSLPAGSYGLYFLAGASGPSSSRRTTSRGGRCGTTRPRISCASR